MAKPNERKQSDSQQKPDWPRKHHNVQMLIAIGGLAGLGILILQWCQMRDTLRLDQRAWATVASAELVKRTAPNEKPQVAIKIVNSGKTAALEVKVLGAVYLAAQEPGSVGYPKDTSRYPSAVIGPGSNPIYVTLERPPLGPDEDLAIRDNSNGVYAHGEIRYVDIFGKRHTTGFCFSVHQKDMNDPEQISNFDMTACETLNWAN
jgi:hypothetical protein